MTVQMEEEDVLVDMFGGDETVKEEVPAGKLVNYTRPSTGETISVHLVANHVLWVSHGQCRAAY